MVEKALAKAAAAITRRVEIIRQLWFIGSSVYNELKI